MTHKEAEDKCQFQLWRIYQYHSCPKRAIHFQAIAQQGLYNRDGVVRVWIYSQNQV